MDSLRKISTLHRIGQLTEEAQETRNKDFQRIREFNMKKISRMETNIDLGHE